MTNYKIDSRKTFSFDFNVYVIVTATFFTSSETFQVIELYKIDDGLEMFQGLLRGEYSVGDSPRAGGSVARFARDFLVFEEMAQAA